ncbi:MAG: efflux RND transporter periplasmic adaptor subunit [Alphaproteobacteria bacterium]|nr:efflux RND transporter periplasmic adaptor subunit [Alphaproteobacteria bacterium]
MLFRFNTLKPPQKVAIIITLVLLGYLLVSNIFFTHASDEEARVALTSEKDLSSILATEKLAAESHQLHITLNGVTEANRLVRLKAQVEGTVSELRNQEGDEVNSGDVIMRIDERDRRARVAQAKALLNQRKVEFDAAKKLNQKGVYSDVRFAQSKAQYEEAKAILSASQDALNNTYIRAPFDGVLEEISVEKGDLVGRGFVVNGDDSVATIIDYDPLIVTGQIPQQQRTKIQSNLPVTIRLLEGTVHQGKIRHIGTVTDPDTRTFKVEVEIPNPNGALPVGISAEMRLPAGNAMAYNIAPSTLSQNEAGEVGVKTVDENGIVQFKTITVLEDDDKGFWVGGLPASITLVTTGQGFVNAGQSINAKPVAAQE